MFLQLFRHSFLNNSNNILILILVVVVVVLCIVAIQTNENPLSLRRYLVTLGGNESLHLLEHTKRSNDSFQNSARSLALHRHPSPPPPISEPPLELCSSRIDASNQLPSPPAPAKLVILSPRHFNGRAGGRAIEAHTSGIHTHLL
jgi:hypothetical protein